MKRNLDAVLDDIKAERIVVNDLRKRYYIMGARFEALCQEWVDATQAVISYTGPADPVHATWRYTIRPSQRTEYAKMIQQARADASEPLDVRVAQLAEERYDTQFAGIVDGEIIDED